MALEIVAIGDRDDEPLLDAFYAGIYLDAFAHQVEPLAVWKQRLWTDAPAPYDLTIRIAGDRLHDPAARRIDAGIVYERYRESGCGLVTYLVVAHEARRHGLGRTLLAEAVRSLDAACVFGEVSDPAAYVAGAPERAEAWRRVALFQRWGARVLDIAYVQPRLGVGLERDRALRLVAFAPAQGLPPALRGDVVRRFLRELFTITEGAPVEDDEAATLLASVPEAVPLVELAP